MNEQPAEPGEWGFRPADGAISPVNPPGFVWRPQQYAAAYELQCARDPGFGGSPYLAADIRYNCHGPPKTFDQGKWYWRFRYTDRSGRKSAWSGTRSFVVTPRSIAFP
ncbi:MAG: DUF4962 domain-containing protein, partial [Phycisphaerae bacterium]